MFFNPEARVWHDADVLEKTANEIRKTCPQEAEFILDTQKKRNPIMFCSGKCEDSWMKTLVCVKCDGLESKTEPFPNIDDVGGEAWYLKDDWQLNTSCASCAGFMAPRGGGFRTAYYATVIM